MNRKLVIVMMLILVLLLGTGTALAAGSYTLSWWAAPGGGGTSSSPGSYSLVGGAGQPAVGKLSGSGYTLSEGFWVGGTGNPGPGHGLYLPLIMK